jgi:putative transposase
MGVDHEGEAKTEEQIIAVLKEAEAGARTKKLCRRHGISEPTYCYWKAK